MVSNGSEQKTLDWSAEAEPFLKAAGQATNFGLLYGAHHKLTAEALNACYAELEQLLGRHPRVNLAFVGDQLRINGQVVVAKLPLVRVFLDKLKALRITAISLTRGITWSEFERLMDLIIRTRPSKDAEAFQRLLAEQDLAHVRSERVRLELVSESQEIVEKTEAPPPKLTSEEITQIVAFLKGEIAASEPLEKKLEEAASDADRLAELILEAAAVRQRVEDLVEVETLADVVVGCLRRTFEGLVRRPSAKTQKGKIALKKTVLMLEKKVLDRLRQVMRKADQNLDAAVAEAVEEMVSDMEVENLVQEYARKKQGLDKVEARILRTIRTHGADSETAQELRARLEETGLLPTGWQQLVARSGAAKAAGVAPDPMALGVLALLLGEMDSLMAGVTDPRALGNKLAEIGQKAQEASLVVQERIEELGRAVQHAARAAEKTKAEMPPREVANLLAEIAQELIQFVSAINCAVAMLLKGLLGTITPEQRQVLNVASDCGQRLGDLLGRLVEIVGLPEGLHPMRPGAPRPNP